MFKPKKHSPDDTGTRKRAAIVLNKINNDKVMHSQNDNEFSNRLHSLDWCCCNGCQTMPTLIESNCCQENQLLIAQLCKDVNRNKSCIATTESFKKLCLDKKVLKGYCVP